jgi:hypothetical protein
MSPEPPANFNIERDIPRYEFDGDTIAGSDATRCRLRATM